MANENAQRGGLAAIIGGAAAATLFIFTPANEGTVLKTYRDPAGVLTYCTGATESAQWGRTYSRDECLAQLDRDLTRHAAGIAQCVDMSKLTDGQKIAYVDFAFNLGVTAFCRSSIASRAKAGDMLGSCNALLLYTTAKVNRPVLDAFGRPVMLPDGSVKMAVQQTVLPGLVKRRNAERAYCLGQKP